MDARAVCQYNHVKPPTKRIKVMPTQQQIGVILQDLAKAEGDLKALVHQASTDTLLPAPQINGLMGMQDTALNNLSKPTHSV